MPDIDFGQLSEALNDKMDRDVQNAGNAGKATISNFAMPGDTYEDLTLGASGTRYTAPADGYVAIEKRSSGNNQYLGIWVKNHNLANVDYYVSFSCFANQEVHRVFVPIKKGEYFDVGYTAGGTVGFFRFIYAQGES
jgi:hypothetical protein